jgi:adenosylcobinamide-phosphate synthase
MLTGLYVRTDPFAILVLALLLDALIGDPAAIWNRVPHPVRLLGRLIEWLEDSFSDAAAGAKAQRLNGWFAMSLLLAICIVGGAFVTVLLAFTGVQVFLEAVLVAVLLAGRDLYDHVVRVAAALEEGGLAAARDEVGRIVGRDVDGLDEPGVAGAAIESMAEGFCDGLVAPALWYGFFGLPGLLAYKALNTADSMIGHMSDEYRDFGRAAAKLDDWANFVPARLAGLILVGAAWLLPGTDARRAYETMRRDAPRHHSPNAGWTEAAVAGALGLAIAGPRRYGGELREDAWMGDGRRELTAADIRRALRLYLHAGGLFLVLMFVFAVLNR